MTAPDFNKRGRMMKEKVILTTFTDPMMGLSYECEPIFRKLETHFARATAFKVSRFFRIFPDLLTKIIA